MSTPAVASPDLSSRRAPGLGGFNMTALGLEIRRFTRNRRTLVFVLIMPIVLFLLFGVNASFVNQRVGHGNVSAFIMISIALYGAALATTSGGAMVAIERAAGWSRQLRLTPLAPAAYIAIKLLAAMMLGLISVVVVYAIGRATGKPQMPGYLWLATGASVWVGSLLFAAFGLFLGYLLPTENVMQILGFVLMIFAFGGGLFIPLSEYPHVLQTLATYPPLFGLNELTHAPLLGGSINISWVANVLAWLVIFAGGAIWRFRKDTARV